MLTGTTLSLTVWKVQEIFWNLSSKFTVCHHLVSTSKCCFFGLTDGGCLLFHVVTWIVAVERIGLGFLRWPHFYAFLSLGVMLAVSSDGSLNVDHRPKFRKTSAQFTPFNLINTKCMYWTIFGRNDNYWLILKILIAPQTTLFVAWGTSLRCSFSCCSLPGKTYKFS